MRRWWLLVIPMVAVMGLAILPAGRAARFAVDPDAPWVVVDSARFDPVEHIGGEGPLVGSVSPRGAWLYGHDPMETAQPQCYWSTTTWERTCIELELGEVAGHASPFAWSPDDSAFVVTTYLRDDEAGGIARLLLVETETGSVTSLVEPAATTHINAITFSPDGAHLAFVEIVDAEPIRLRRLDRTGENLDTILTASETVTLSDVSSLHWTVDDSLVFYSGPFASDTQGYWRVMADGSGLTRITAVSPGGLATGELQYRIRDVSADGRLMIAEADLETGACGPEFLTASWFIVDLARDEIVQAICAVYQRDVPGVVAARLPAGVRAIVRSDPAFLPDNSVVVLVEQRSGDDVATGLAVLDGRTGQLRIVSNDLSQDASLWSVSSALDDGSVRAWVAGYWRDVVTLAPRAS